MINCCSYSKPPTRHCQELNRLTRARRDRAIGDHYGFADAQFEYAAREARRGSVDRDLRPGAAGNDDGLRTLSDRVEPPAYRVGGTPSIVGERAVRKPRKRNLAQRVVPGIIDNGRVGTQWRRAVDAVRAKELPAISQSFELPFIPTGLPVWLLVILLPIIVIRSALWKTMLASGTTRFVPSMTFPLTTTSLFPPSPTIAEPSHCLMTLPAMVWREVPEESR